MTVPLARLIGEDAAVPQGAGSLAIHGLTSDSRAVKPGFLFAALPGSSVDGARFIPQAIKAGAVAILAGEGVAADGAAVVTARNPRQAFARMAARFYGRQPDLIAAVTGTNGKTSVASFVREIW
ncbi:MAG: Mur ligase domain-containing protein, partial [Aestuariivirga sp.]